MSPIPKNYSGLVNVKIIKMYQVVFYYPSTIDVLDNKNIIKVNVCDYDGKSTFINLRNKTVKIVYIDNDDIYESIDNSDELYLIRFIGLCK